MAQYANEPTPCLQLFFAQCFCDVGEHEQRMWASVLSKRSASYLPATGCAGECHVHGAGRFTDETVGESNLLGGASKQSLRHMTEKAFTSAVHESQTLIVVEREYGNVNVGHHRSQQCGRLHRAQPLRAQCFAQQIRLEICQSERVLPFRTARPNGVVTLAQCREHVRQGLQRADDTFSQHERRNKPRAEYDEAERTLHFGAVIVTPKQGERHDDARQSRKQRQLQHPPLVRR